MELPCSEDVFSRPDDPLLESFHCIHVKEALTASNEGQILRKTRGTGRSVVEPTVVRRKIDVEQLHIVWFPKDEALRKKWEIAVGGENWSAPPLSFLCSDHFEPDEFDKSGKVVRVLRGAIPSIFSNTRRDDHLEQLTANVESIDIDDNSNSNFGHCEGAVGEDIHNFDCSRDSFSDNETPLNERIANAMKRLTQNSNMKFMENFDPEKSNRERRKLSRKFNSGGKKQAAIYDDKGVLIASGKDVCDCMNLDCPGCHFPCPRCQSPKCGHECRVNRKWTYECIEIEGTEIIITPNESIFRRDS
ncbi:ARL14 effector protein-like [Ischnura elegans]|uniref:ARL14 effector protein-like n=1 Tax=Ischnura elegans TaxID=197161 RepID=UPI001ED89E60|nr:ARL14 effector protein-like [Ischnura elegans]